jgi:hypothetical protein
MVVSQMVSLDEGCNRGVSKELRRVWLGEEKEEEGGENQVLFFLLRLLLMDVTVLLFGIGMTTIPDETRLSTLLELPLLFP